MDNKISYLIGRQVAGNLLQQGIDVELESFFKGIEEGFADKPLPMSHEEAGKLLQQFDRDLKEKMQKQKRAFAEETLKAGQKFLERNKQNKDIKSTASGIQYRVIQDGTGSIPKSTDTVETHYEGKLITGEIFDSSIQRGETVSFPVRGVIQGWQEVLQLMKVGSIWQVYIPSHLAYGEHGSPPKIAPNAVLEFRIELIDIV